MQWPAQRIKEGPSRALGRRAIERIAEPPLIDDRRLTDRAVRIDRDPDFDDEILGIASARWNVPAARDLLPHQVYFARCNLAAERSTGLR